MLKPTPIEVEDQENNLDSSVRTLYVLTFPDAPKTENKPQATGKPAGRATSMYKNDAIRFVANMTHFSEELIAVLLNSYIGTIGNYLLGNGHYQEKRVLKLSKWGNYTFDDKVSVTTNSNYHPYLLAGVTFKSSKSVNQKLCNCINSKNTDWDSCVWQFDESMLKYQSKKAYMQKSLSIATTPVTMPDLSKKSWTEADLVNAISFQTHIVKKVVKYVLRAFHQGVIDYFMLDPQTRQMNGKFIRVEGMGTFSWCVDEKGCESIIMKPGVKAGKELRQAISTRKKPVCTKKRGNRSKKAKA